MVWRDDRARIKSFLHSKVPNSENLVDLLQEISIKVFNGLPYDIEHIQLSDKPDWFLALAPTGQVPLLITKTGQALFESDAIIE